MASTALAQGVFDALVTVTIRQAWADKLAERYGKWYEAAKKNGIGNLATSSTQDPNNLEGLRKMDHVVQGVGQRHKALDECHRTR